MNLHGGNTLAASSKTRLRQPGINNSVVVTPADIVDDGGLPKELVDLAMWQPVGPDVTAEEMIPRKKSMEARTESKTNRKGRR